MAGRKPRWESKDKVKTRRARVVLGDAVRTLYVEPQASRGMAKVLRFAYSFVDLFDGLLMTLA